VLPLALYLISFILAFDHPRWYVRPVFLALLPLLLPAMAYYIPSLDLRIAAPLYLVGMFVACMVCHGELARLKPDPAHLTRFYLMISLGGALGAVLVATYLMLFAVLALPIRIVYGLLTARREEELARIFESYEERARRGREEHEAHANRSRINP
jgi:hypothetical protein